MSRLKERIGRTLAEQGTSSRRVLRDIIKKKVARKTRKRYRGFYRNLKDTLEMHFGSRKVTKNRFRRWVAAAYSAKVGGSTPECYRSAVLFYQHTHGKKEWAADEEIAEACRIHLARAKARAKPTGTLTRKMLKRLLRYVKKRDPMAAMCMTLHTLVGGRINQVLRIRNGDFQPDDFGKAVLKLRTDKRRRRNGKRRATKHHDKVVPDEARKVAKRIAKKLKVSHGKRLFFMFSKTSGAHKIGNIIKEAARKLRFPSGYRYVGSHVLRHCGTAMLLEQSELLMRDLSTQMSRSMQRHYGNPLAMR
jgi:hypothetical protein